MRRQDVLLVLFDDVQGLDAHGPLEVFAAANTWCAARGSPEPYRLATASVDGAAVTTTAGLRVLPDAAVDAVGVPDVLLVPGGEGAFAVDQRLVDWVRDVGSRAPRVVSVCTGAFLLAQVGLLDGRRATTHWAYCARLAESFPDVIVDPEPIFVRDGGTATSAGVTAGIDLALALVEEDIGRTAALTIARHLVVFLRRPGNQAQFSAQLSAQLATREPLREVQRWIVENPDADLSVPALARRCGLSQRQFARAFAREVGIGPGRYVDRARLEAARLRLEDTPDSVERVARACGYGTPEAMRRAFLRVLAVGPAEYRRRFQTVHTGE